MRIGFARHPLMGRQKAVLLRCKPMLHLMQHADCPDLPPSEEKDFTEEEVKQFGWADQVAEWVSLFMTKIALSLIFLSNSRYQSEQSSKGMVAIRSANAASVSVGIPIATVSSSTRSDVSIPVHLRSQVNRTHLLMYSQERELKSSQRDTKMRKRNPMMMLRSGMLIPIVMSNTPIDCLSKS